MNLFGKVCFPIHVQHLQACIADARAYCISSQRLDTYMSFHDDDDEDDTAIAEGMGGVKSESDMYPLI